MAHHHDHGHGNHAHSHAHAHIHAPGSFGRAFAIGIALNTAFVGAEALAGVLGHSVALLADAGHNLGDILGLIVAWAAHVLTQRAPSRRFTYGLGGSSILAALFNAVVLLLVVGALTLEALRRLANPEPVAGGIVMVVAAGAVVVNGVTAWLFAAGRKADLNLKGAYLHMLSDALVSVGVIAGGGLIVLTGWLWVDPVVSIAVNLVIVVGTWGLLRDSVALALQAVPPGIDAAAVRRMLLDRPGVASLHDLHIWPMSTTGSALTVHLLMPDGRPDDRFLTESADLLHELFDIDHATIQVETDPATPCRLASDQTV